jgi:hypothetical protein
MQFSFFRCVTAKKKMFCARIRMLYDVETWNFGRFLIHQANFEAKMEAKYGVTRPPQKRKTGCAYLMQCQASSANAA